MSKFKEIFKGFRVGAAAAALFVLLTGCGKEESNKPIATTSVPSTSKTMEVEPTTEAVPTATEVVPTATEVVPTTTEVVPTATEVVPTATEVVPTTTEAVPTATEVVPTTTEAVPEIVDVTVSYLHGVPAKKFSMRLVSCEKSTVTMDEFFDRATYANYARDAILGSSHKSAEYLYIKCELTNGDSSIYVEWLNTTDGIEVYKGARLDLIDETQSSLYLNVDKGGGNSFGGTASLPDFGQADKEVSDISIDGVLDNTRTTSSYSFDPFNVSCSYEYYCGTIGDESSLTRTRIRG